MYSFMTCSGVATIVFGFVEPFCCALVSCFGLSNVLFLEVSPVEGLTRGRVDIPFTWTPFT